MMKKGLLFLCAGWLLGYGNVQGAQIKPEDGFDLKPSEARAIIGQAYMNLAKLSAAAGEGLKFEIAHPRTIASGQFAKTFWLDVVTMPGGDMIDMVRETYEKDGQGSAILYRPKWKLAGENYLQTEEGSRLQGMRVDQVLAEVARENAEMSDAVALTSYDVRVSYQGRSRSYKALVVWLRPRAGKNRVLLFMDHITQGVEEAARERPGTLRPARRRAPADLFGSKAAAGTCYETSTTQRRTQSLEGYDGHYSGSHSASADVDFSCSCQSDCSATCEPSFATQSCSETGTHWDSCHNMSTSASLATSSSGDGRTSAPGCSAGLGCVKKSCLFCSCGLSVSVEASGTTVKFTASGDPDWTGNLTFSHTCAVCQEVVYEGGGGGDGGGYHGPDQQTAPDDPTGGSGGGCHVWHTSCSGYSTPGGYYYECHPDYCLW